MNFSEEERRERALKIFEILKSEYPNARCLLDYKNPFELLVATILAAQCTDERVNMATVNLFKEYPNPESMAEAEREKLEALIRSTGFYRNKAKSLINVSKALVERYSGKLPETVEELASLPGVGRKTGNVVAGNCFGKPAIIVDTHVKRVALRLGLCRETQPDKIERELKKLILEKDETHFSYVLNFHGRYVCKARKPSCGTCPVKDLCPSSETGGQIL
ncbi:MAG: endonuclease III [Spirochaetes bacterium]|nr:MAG: endonuclease III [Spirochaetota bacterium]